MGLKCSTSPVRGASSARGEQRPVLKNPILAVLHGSVLHQPLALYPNKLALFFFIISFCSAVATGRESVQNKYTASCILSRRGGGVLIKRENSTWRNKWLSVCVRVCTCTQGSLCLRASKRNRFPFFFFFNPSKADWPFLLYCGRTKHCGVEMSAVWADREKADGVHHWWKKGAAQPILQLGFLFLPLCLLAASSWEKPGWPLQKKKIILHKGNRNREEGFSRIYATRKLPSAAANKGEGCWEFTVCTEENRIQCTCTIQGHGRD